MPSRKKKTSRSKRKKSYRAKSSAKKNNQQHVAFLPIVFLVFLLWVLYRNLFAFPVWFDETIGKAIFFALPVWAYVVISNSKQIPQTFSFRKLKSGLLKGIAIGGIFGFIASLLGLLQHGGQVQSALLFTADAFWWEFFLALFTSFWETLFFFSFVMVIINQKFAQWDLIKRVLLTALIFAIFHIPNAILRFDGSAIIYQIFLLTLFGIGQALLFEGTYNAYSLVLSQAIWGMVLLVHF